MNTLYEDEKQTTDLKPVSNLIFWGLLLFFLFEYIRPGSYLPIPGKLNTIIPLFVFLATFISKDGRSNLTILNASNTKWLLFYILLFPIQAFTADVTYYVFLTFKKIVGYFLIYFVIIKQVTSLRRINAIFSTLIFLHFWCPVTDWPALLGLAPWQAGRLCWLWWSRLPGWPPSPKRSK